MVHQGANPSNVIWILWIKSWEDLILNSPNLYAYQSGAQQQSLFLFIIITAFIL